MKFKICVLTNEDNINYEKWIKSLSNCQNIDYYDIVKLTDNNWLQQLQQKPYDLIILHPPGKTDLFKRLYDERVLLISTYLKTPVYPSPNEVFIYENKRYLRDWLMINKLPHPETFVFFDKSEALKFINNRKNFPIVGKTNIGASGNGISILYDKESCENYINTAFKSGIKPRIGLKISKGSILKKIKKIFKGKKFIKQRLSDYQADFLNIQYHFVILQEYIKHDFEWRCVKIGDSFFAHKKIVDGEMASGTLIKGYDKVPLELLNFIKDISDLHNLNSVAIDVFEQNNSYLINEIQCYFGQSDPYQMLVDNEPGRYVFKGNCWVFEKGMFNTNESYDLRLSHAISTLKK